MGTFKRVVYIIVITTLITIIWSCGDQAFVAKVGNIPVTAKEFRNYVITKKRGLDAISDFDGIMNQLNDLIDEKIIYIEAKKQGLGNDSSIVAEIDKVEQSRVYMAVIEQEVFEKVIPTSMLREKYRRQGKEVKARHIFLPVGKNAAQAKVEEKVQQLKEIRGQIIRGSDFGTMARKFSKDSLSAGKGGDLGFLGWGEREYGELFYQTLFNLRKNQISDVVRSDKGVHLLKVEEIRSLDQQPFELQKTKLRRSFYREYNAELDSHYYALVDYVKEKYNAVYHKSSIDSLLKWNKDSKYILPRGTEAEKFFKELTPDQKDLAFVTYKNGAFTTRDIFNVYTDINPYRRPPFSKPAQVEQFLDRNVSRILISRLGRERGYHRKESVREQVQEKREELMIQKMRNEGYKENIDLTEEELRTYYEKNPQKFEKNAQVSVQEIMLDTRAQAEKIAERAKKGESFDRLASMYTIRAKTKSKKGKLGYISKNQYGIVGRRAIEMKAGEISDPIANGTQYSVIKILDRRDGELQDFKDVKGEIERILRNEKKRDAYNVWLEGLREKTPVVIYKGVLKKNFGFIDE